MQGPKPYCKESVLVSKTIKIVVLDQNRNLNQYFKIKQTNGQCVIEYNKNLKYSQIKLSKSLKI